MKPVRDIRDFEQVCWKTDPYGNPLAELDKSDLRTHVSELKLASKRDSYDQRKPIFVF